VIHEVDKPEDLNASASEWFRVLYKNSKNDEEVVASMYSWVDVRDVAEAHVVALEKPDAGGERILFSAGMLSLTSRWYPTQPNLYASGNLGPFTWQDFSKHFRILSHIPKNLTIL